MDKKEEYNFSLNHGCVCKCFLQVFILEELLSPIITPFILIFLLRNKSLEIIDFFRNFTVEVVGVGDICSFAQMDIRRHGNPQVCVALSVCECMCMITVQIHNLSP